MTKYILEIGTPSAFKGCSPIENIVFNSYKEAEKWFHKAKESGNSATHWNKTEE